MISELIAVGLPFAAGVLVLRWLGESGWSLVPFGFLAGISIKLVVVFAQVATPLPTSPYVTFAIVALVAVVAAAARPRGGGSRGLPWFAVGATAAVLAGAVAALRWARLVKWHSDSFEYLVLGRLMATGDFYEGFGPKAYETRGIGVAALHVGADFAGEYYLASATPLVAVAVLLAIPTIMWRGLRDRVPASVIIAFAAAAVALLAATNRFVWHAVYLNGHLLFGVFVAVGAGAAWLLGRNLAGSRAALLAVACAPLPVLVMTRAEGSAFAVIYLAAVLLQHGLTGAERRVIAVVAGGSILAWNLLGAWVSWSFGDPLQVTVLAQAALGAVLIAGYRLAGAATLESARDVWQRWFVAALLAAVFLLTLLRPIVAAKSIFSTAENLTGAGGWGKTLLWIGALVAFALVALRVRDSAALLLPVALFIPFAMAAALARGGGYRVGVLDSLSRMWIQILPLAVLTAAVWLAAGEWRPYGPAIATWWRGLRSDLRVIFGRD